MAFGPTIGGVRLANPVLNAAGTCKTQDDVARFARSTIGAIVVGSVTCKPRQGNAGKQYHSEKTYSVNSFGMPNGGAAYYREHLPAMVRTAHAGSKPLVLSVAGFAVEEYAELARLGLDSEADLIELNLGCPNAWEDGRQERIISFDPKLIKEVLVAVQDIDRIGVKLSPYSDPHKLAEVAATLAGSSVRFITTSNTFPNALAGTDQDSISGGFGGPALKPVALGQVRQLKALLPNTDIVGVGGVASARDVAEYLAAGASAVQAATMYLDADRDVAAFDRIITDLG